MKQKSQVLPNYREVQEYLDQFTNYERKTDYTSGPETLGLSRIRHLLQLLGNPQQSFKSIHIAGTKGKGSTAHLTAALLNALGHKVGLYTSPHLVTVRERIAISGQPCSEEIFCECFAGLRPKLDLLRQNTKWTPPTYFENLTALAFLIFARLQVDVAVVEVGLGGRFDATNILQPEVTAITPISLDHTLQLGNTIAKIAAEKGGIIKTAVPLLLADQPDEADIVISKIATDKNTRIYREGTPNLRAEIVKSNALAADRAQTIAIQTWHGCYQKINFQPIGLHQVKNATLAAGVAESFQEKTGGRPLSASSIRRAWNKFKIPGRIVCLHKDPWVILDAAHNPASAWVLSEAIRERFHYEQFALVFAVAKDKDIAGILKILLPMADHVIFTEAGHERSCPVNELIKIASPLTLPKTQITTDPKPRKALETARNLVGHNGFICITGSFYLAGKIYESINK